MTIYVQQVLKTGKNNLLATGFTGITANEFGYMAFGKSTITPTESGTTALGQECSSSDGSYTRVSLVNTADTDNRRVTSEAILPTTNVTNSTTITEVGICDTSTLSSGIFFCVCQIPPITKNSDKSVTITITTTFDSS